MKNKELIVDNGKLIMESFKIGDKKYLELIMGQSPPSKFYNTDKIGLPFFQGKKQFGKLYPTVDTWCSEPKKIALKGDILLSVRAPVGPTNLAKEKCCIGRGLAALRPNSEKLLTKYVLYFFNNLELELQSKGQGSTFKAIAAKDLRNMTIACPPLPEQRRIVSKLDGLFAEIDASLALIDQNIEQAEALKLSVLDEEFGKVEQKEKLIEVAEFRPKKSEVREMKDVDCSFLPMKDLNEKQIDFEPKETRKIGKVYKGYTYFRDNDVLLAKVTPCFQNRKAGVAKNLTNGIGFGSSEYFVFRPSEKIMSEYLYYFLMTADMINKGVLNMSGAVGLKRVPTNFIKNIEVPWTQIETQEKIVVKIENIFAEIDGLVSDYQQKREDFEALKSSLLDRAFKGEL